MDCWSPLTPALRVHPLLDLGYSLPNSRLPIYAKFHDCLILHKFSIAKFCKISRLLRTLKSGCPCFLSDMFGYVYNTTDTWPESSRFFQHFFAELFSRIILKKHQPITIRIFLDYQKQQLHQN